MSDKQKFENKAGEETVKVIYAPAAEKWHGVYYPGLPSLPLTDDELVELARVHAYHVQFVRSLYAIQKEKVKDASNSSA
jgi:hypothetical protein